MSRTTGAREAASIVAGVGTEAAIRKASSLDILVDIDAAEERERRCQARSAVLEALAKRKLEVRRQMINAVRALPAVDLARARGAAS